MPDDEAPAPRQYQGVMVSSTFTDLVEHRDALINAINGQHFKPVVMENDTAKPGVDVIQSSLTMVRDSAACVLLISHKYGQTPECPDRNAGKLSITELEFNEAMRLDRPILLFIMGDKHSVMPNDVETDTEKRAKLAAFRERAKQLKAGSTVHRIYDVFNSLEEFRPKAMQAIGNLRDHLGAATPSPEPSKPPTTPLPRAFLAEPPYIASHPFIGRQAELERLTDWAAPANAHPVLLFEAIGGNGKSRLTWEWTTNHAPAARADWAGRFWYSFYERGAVMVDFCRRALAYITARPVETFHRRQTADLAAELLAHLRARPYLLVLDGLERVLVAYHRFDAAQLRDEDAEAPDSTDRRTPTSAIRPEDDDLLHTLATAAPSKILVTSRLIPHALVNQGNQPILGVLHERLPGLRPADAAALLRSFGISGSDSTIRDYLQTHADCHPLVIGVLAGLINAPGRHRGHFDGWANDPAGGGALNLAALDLVQKRNHILTAATAALDAKNRQLLSTLALISEAVDYATLEAINPHLPPKPEEVPAPRKPEERYGWNSMSAARRKFAQQEYTTALQRRKDYEQAITDRLQSAEYRAAPNALIASVADLEQRGLLQYDPQAQRYDLHPVVRGVAAGGLAAPEKENLGQRVVDYFSRQPHNPWEQAETLDDVRTGLHVVRTLLQMGRHQAAADAYTGDLAHALAFNLEEDAQILALLRPFCTPSWDVRVDGLEGWQRSYLTNAIALAFQRQGNHQEARAAYGRGLLLAVQDQNWRHARSGLSNLANSLFVQNRLAQEDRYRDRVLALTAVLDDKEHLFRARLYKFTALVTLGHSDAAERMWRLLHQKGRAWSRATYQPGDAEHWHALFRFQQVRLSEADLTAAETLARDGHNRQTQRDLLRLRGDWHLSQGDFPAAEASLRQAIAMARAVGQSDVEAEAMLARAQFQLGTLALPWQEAARLAAARFVAHRPLAELWRDLGDPAQATLHAREAYKWAWADGEPFVRRHELIRATALLTELNAPIPELPPYDPAKDERFPWEGEVFGAIDAFIAEQKAEKT